MQNGKQKSKQEIDKRVRFVLFSLVLLILVYPFLDDTKIGLIIYACLLTVILIAAVYSFGYDRHHFILTFGLGVTYIIINWINVFVYNPLLTTANTIVSILFFGYIVSIIVRNVINEREVNINTVSGAISGYLLIGLTFASIYSLIEFLNPHSFSAAVNWENLMYYSFVTLTSLGGNIGPVSSAACSTTILESILGVFYIALLIASLLGRIKISK